MENSIKINGSSSSSSGYIDLNQLNSTTSTSYDNWGTPVRVEVNEVGETIEMIYKQTSNIVYSTWPVSRPEDRVFKIVYSCKDGKWHKSNPIYGKIIPAQAEYYEFEG